MIPSARTLLDAYNVVARENGHALGPNIATVRAGREDAVGLTQHPHDEDINLEGLPFEYVRGWFWTRLLPLQMR